MDDNLRKFFLYFDWPEAYWQLTDPTQSLRVDSGAVGRYPLNLLARLEQGHYTRFDAQGLPVRRARDGREYHNCTTLCSYALAHWDRYLISGNQQDANSLLQVADYLVDNAIIASNGAYLLVDDRAVPRLSAMNQGEGMSVLIRAWEVTKNQRYRDAACRCLPPFTRTLDNQGVMFPFRRDKAIPWYEEYACYPVRHVLNGMIYALWGLREVMLATDDNLACELFEQGVNSVCAILRYYDSGHWSYYAVRDEGANHPVASVMYHNLHIVQLIALFQQTNKPILLETATRFQNYSSTTGKRLHAGWRLLMRKINEQFTR